MRELTHEELRAVAAGSVHGGFGGTGRRPYRLLDPAGEAGEADPIVTGNGLAGTCPMGQFCESVLRADGSDTGLVRSLSDGKLYVGNELAEQRDAGFNIDWQGVAADLAAIGGGAASGTTGGVAQQLAGMFGLAGAYFGSGGN